MSGIEFTPFPKIARLNRDITIEGDEAPKGPAGHALDIEKAAA